MKPIGIIFIPGVSGGAFQGRYQDLENSLKKNYLFLKYQSWQNIKELGKLTLNKIFYDLDNLIDLLEKKGCKKVILIGKSFGGGIVLLYNNSKTCGKVLWAPAISISEKPNYKECMSKGFSNFEKFTDIKIDKEFLKKIKIPILIIHGDRDRVVPLDSSKQIIESIKKGDLFIMEEVGHSFKKSNAMEIVNQKTVEFVNKIT